MLFVSMRKCVFFLCFALAVGALPDDAEAAASGTDKGLFGTVKEKYYDDLPPPGKFGTGVAVGFVGSRLTVKSASSALKAAGATFVV